MTKKKKNLTWKLKELPSAGELADLVDSEVLTKEEAREIMFGNPENDKEKAKALEEQVEFLRDLVRELSKRNTTTITTWPYHREIRYYNTPYWAETTKVLCNAGLALNTTSTSGNSITSTSENKIANLTRGSGIAIGSTTGSVNAVYTASGSNLKTDWNGGGNVTMSVSSINSKDNLVS